jgi:predicted dehydrogenase
MLDGEDPNPMRSYALLLLAVMTPALTAAEHTIAVVGLVHGHAWGHLTRMVKNPTARLVGVAESEPALVAEAVKRGVPADIISPDWKQMIANKKPEIVWAFVENNRHLEIVQFCAPRGIHVMFEKPLASTYQDAKEIRALAAKYGIYILTNYQMAWWPANYVAKQAADGGKVGEVWRLHGIVGHGGPGGPTGLNKFFVDWLTDPEKNGGGALVDFECYNALWSLWYLGRPETVYAQVNHIRPKEFPKVEDNATVVLHYPRAVAILEGSWDLPRGYQDLEVMGLEGSLLMTSSQVTLRKGKGEPEQLPLKDLPADAAEPVASMIHSIETKTAPAGLIGLDVNVQVVEIIEAAKESVRSGRAVPLPR